MKSMFGFNRDRSIEVDGTSDLIDRITESEKRASKCTNNLTNSSASDDQDKTLNGIDNAFDSITNKLSAMLGGTTNTNNICESVERESEHVNDLADSHASNNQTLQEQEILCEYCGKQSDTEHEECIKDCKSRETNGLCKYCGLKHGRIKCKTYLNYGVEKIVVLQCEYCKEPIHPKYGTANGHNSCLKEKERRRNENMCRFCGDALVYSKDIGWGWHQRSCASIGYFGYKAPDQKMELKVGYYPKSIFKTAEKRKRQTVKHDSHNNHLESADIKEKIEIKPANFDAVGGLDKEIEKLREIIELPLLRPELFENIGISSPKGVLLHGPSGTGKTLLAKTMAEQHGMYFTYVSAPSLLNAWVGVTERLIRELFENAIENAPSIIFVDEIDSICKNRSDADRNYQKDMAEQFLTSMDDLEYNQVVVIGATNHPDDIDPAFRRPGRFDVEMEIGLPDENGRHHILKIHTAQMPLNGVNLRTLAEQTHGFTGADIVALVNAAGMSSIRESVKDAKINVQSTYGTTVKKSSRMVTNKNFENALKTIKPSTLRSTERTISDVAWDDIGGLDSIRTTIMEDVIWPVKYPQECSHMNINASKGILLYGPPGTGKTMIAKAIANGTESNFVTVGCSDLISSRPGETEKNIKKVFDNARRTKPCVLFLDEIDSILIGRTSDVNNNRIVTQILLELDGVVQSDGVILIGATNMPELIDSAMMRPGRFDKIIEVKLPDIDARESIIKVHIGKRPHGTINYKKLADMSDGFTGADIAHVVNTAASSALRRHIGKGTGNVKNLKLVQRDVEDAITKIKQKRQVI